MAFTLAAGAAFDTCKVMIKRMPLDDIKAAVCDDAHKILWLAAPWRWTVASFPAVTLAANTQDYSVSLPSDFLYLQEAFITNQVGDVIRHLQVAPILPSGGSAQIPNEIAVTGTPGSTGTVRFFPKIGTIKSGDTLVLKAIYKKQAPLIDNSTVNTAGYLQIDDSWYWVYRSGVLYYAYLYADDPRAGAAILDDKGNWKFTEQRGTFETNISIMKDREKLASYNGRLVQEPRQP